MENVEFYPQMTQIFADGRKKGDFSLFSSLCLRASVVKFPHSEMKRGIFIVLLLCLGIAAYIGWDHWREHRYDAMILAAARRYQMPPELIKAVIWRESRFNAQVHGKAGELGLMQIRSAAAQEWAKSEHLAGFQHEWCLDPLTNALAGTWYLRKTIHRYNLADNPIPYGLADYNAGRSHILKWCHGGGYTNSDIFIGQIEFPGTKKYVQAIMGRAEHYKGSFEGSGK